jgi:hypothetical protein
MSDQEFDVKFYPHSGEGTPKSEQSEDIGLLPVSKSAEMVRLCNRGDLCVLQMAGLHQEESFCTKHLIS